MPSRPARSYMTPSPQICLAVLARCMRREADEAGQHTMPMPSQAAARARQTLFAAMLTDVDGCLPQRVHMRAYE